MTLQNTDWLNNDWTSACEDRSILEGFLVMPDDVTIGIDDVMSVICDTWKVNMDQLVQDLIGPLEGLQDIISLANVGGSVLNNKRELSIS